MRTPEVTSVCLVILEQGVFDVNKNHYREQEPSGTICCSTVMCGNG